jgi:hypothetical protein
MSDEVDIKEVGRVYVHPFRTAEQAQRTIETWHQLRILTGNRLWTWRTYRRCRQVSFPIPDWVHADFDATAAALDQISNDVYEKKSPPKQLRDRLIKAFGFRLRQGTNPFASAWRDDEQLAMARALKREVLDRDPLYLQQITAAYERTAEKTPFRKRKIRRAWERLRSMF